LTRDRVWIRRILAFGLVAAPVLLLVAGCKEQFPQTALHPESDTALQQQRLLEIIFWWVLGIFVVVEGALLVAVIKFRARPGHPEPAQGHGHTGVEIAWTLAPAVILAFIGVPTVYTIFRTQAPAPANALQVEVIGHQWWWEFRYPELGIVTASDLHVPVGRPVNLKMTSQDVIHSFWVPRLFGKRDVLPGRTNYIWFEADSVGVRPGQCAELCGSSHANMRMQAVVQAPEDFEAWVQAQKAPPALPADSASLAFQGRQLYQQSQCIACHTITGVSAGVIGPNLDHVASRLTLAGAMFPMSTENLSAWLEDPPAIKPGSLMPMQNLTDEQVRALVAFLESLE
jgi:cytochrome c oxidase subunit 2